MLSRTFPRTVCIVGQRRLPPSETPSTNGTAGVDSGVKRADSADGGNAHDLRDPLSKERHARDRQPSGDPLRERGGHVDRAAPRAKSRARYPDDLIV